MEDLIKFIVEYFRSCANKHTLIECYRTGEMYELNESGLIYPLLFLHTNFTFNYPTNGAGISDDYIYFTFKLSILVKSREQNAKKVNNQIKMINAFTVQDEDLNMTHTILQQIINKLNSDLEDDIIRGALYSPNGVSVKRIMNDDCDGWETTLTLRLENPYKCTWMNSFNDDIIDNSTQNKTNKYN